MPTNNCEQGELELQERSRTAGHRECQGGYWLGSQIRSYVLDQSRVKDLRTEIERTDPNKVLDGDLDPFMEACLKAGH